MIKGIYITNSVPYRIIVKNLDFNMAASHYVTGFGFYMEYKHIICYAISGFPTENIKNSYAQLRRILESSQEPAW